MKVLYFGTYDRASPRNMQVISCLRAAGVEVTERHRQVWGRDNWVPGARQLWALGRSEIALARREKNDDADVLVVGYPGHPDMPSARRVARGRPIVFNPLVSAADTLVSDRRNFKPSSLAASLIARLDRRAFRSADLVVADTEAHAELFRQEFGLPHDRVVVAMVGAEDALFRPSDTPREPFQALFVGKLIPLHGLDTIVAAAALVPEIPFSIVGTGQLLHVLDGRSANVEHVKWIQYQDLPAAYQRAGCALGVFGTGPKTSRVIANKVFQALACGCPVITADTPAARELLTDDQDAILVPPGDPEALAAAVKRLAESRETADRIGAAGRATYEARASEAVLGPRWRALLESVLGR